MKRIIKNNAKLFLGILIGIVLSGAVVYAAQQILASDISYDNTSSGLKKANGQDVTNMQEAVDALTVKANSKLYAATMQASNPSGLTFSSVQVEMAKSATGTVTVTPASGYYISAASCTNGYTITGLTTGSSATSAQTVTINNNGNGENSLCTFTVIEGYTVTFAGTNVTFSPSSINVDYNGTETVTITPSSGYYIYTASCTNDYTITGLSTGTSATGAQTITINNNGNHSDSTCTVVTNVACFSGDTLIYTPSGYKEIKDINIGDKVYSYNEKTKKVEESVVSNTIIHSAEHHSNIVYEIKVGKETIRASANHPLYVKKSGENTYKWVEVYEVKAGDYLYTSDFKEVKIVSINIKSFNENYYNFTVEGNHDYFVSKENYLAHNAVSGLW